jgi:glycosyltransferase involved in cell wall biosynthesis
MGHSADSMNIFGLLRVKNEARWIERVVRSIQPVCTQVLVFDDHSSDGTPELCEALGCKVYRSTFDSIHEARDKDFLLAQVWNEGAQLGDYCFMVDGDEALHPQDVMSLKSAMGEGVICGSVHIVYLWDSENQIRVDRWYKEFRRPSLFQLCMTNLSFKRTDFGGNFHCSSAPSQLLGIIRKLPVRLLHFGYMHRADRIRKYEWYNSVDPNNELEDRYRHMVIGDVFPASSSFRWAGPLEVRPL